MKNKIKKKLISVRNFLLKDLIRNIEEQSEIIFNISRANFISRSRLKIYNNEPIHVVFICHMRALWTMFDPLYNYLIQDDKFKVTAIAVPYHHSTLEKNEYKDDNVYEYLHKMDVNVIQGFDELTNTSIAIEDLDPDYVFFQTPYNILPPEFSINRVALFSKVVYMQYGTCLFSGNIENEVHPASFFRHVSFFCMDNKYSAQKMKDDIKNINHYNTHKVMLTGSPKIDFSTSNKKYFGNSWKLNRSDNIKRILWTPRWRTSEKTCHFFEYKDFFIDFCKKNKNVDFVFRPHPLCLQNFLKTGEMNEKNQKEMFVEYRTSQNMNIEFDGSYIDTFMTSDILVTDISSMMWEYFVTGKPIVYTHKTNCFNSLGRELANGCYWVHNENELEKVLGMLISGKDPLLSKRKKIINQLYFLPEGGSSKKIAEMLKNDFFKVIPKRNV